MDHFEIDACLQSMTILVDTREQETVRAEKRYKSFPCPYRKQALSYGDYAYDFIYPSGKPFLAASKHEIPTPVSIERKKDLDELATCFTWRRKQFEAEFVRARENKAPIYLLIENATWEKLLNGCYQSQYHPDAYLASMLAWQIRYGMCPIFCKEETTPRMIYEILRRDLKERLETGYFDRIEGAPHDEKRDQRNLYHA